MPKSEQEHKKNIWFSVPTTSEHKGVNTVGYKFCCHANMWTRKIFGLVEFTLMVIAQTQKYWATWLNFHYLIDLFVQVLTQIMMPA